MSTSYILTNQKVTKKDKKWHAEHVLRWAEFDSKRVNTERRKQQIKAWKYFLCIVDKEKELANKPVTDPFGLNLGMEWLTYPLIEGKLEQMIGEWMLRPMKRKSYVINKRAKTAKLDKMFSMLSEEIMRGISKELEPALGFNIETQDQEQEIPEDIEAFFENGYKTESEEVGDLILTQVLIVKKQINKVKELLLEYLITDDCIAFIDEEDKHPCISKCSIFDTDLDWDPEKEVQNKPQYFARKKWLPYNGIINTFDLKEEEEALLQNYTAQYNANRQNNMPGLDGYDGKDNASVWMRNESNGLEILCAEMHWISKVKIQVKVIEDANGEKQYKRLAPDYKPRKSEKENIEYIWADEHRWCLMVGSELVLDYGVWKNRFSRVDNQIECVLPVVALRRNNHINNNEIRSAAYKLIQLQDIASESLFELRLMQRRNAGRVMVYDAAQIPKHFLKNGGYKNAINRVLHHVKKDQILIINSQDKKGNYNFNQFTSLDMASRGQMQDIMNMLILIEDLAGKFLGMSPQREGQIDQYAGQGTTERAVAQSTARTEIYMNPFEHFLQHVFEKLLMQGKFTYEENEISPYIFGDLKTKFLKIASPFFQDDLGVYFGNNYKEQKSKQIIDRAAEQALSQAQTPDLIMYLIDTLDSEFASESKAVFRQGLKTMQAMEKERRDHEMQIAQEQNKAISEKTQTDAELKREGYEKDIKVAQIYADSKSVSDLHNNTSKERISLAQIEADLLKDQKKTTASSN